MRREKSSLVDKKMKGDANEKEGREKKRQSRILVYIMVEAVHY